MAHAHGDPRDPFYLITDATTNPYVRMNRRRGGRGPPRGRSNPKNGDFQNVKCQRPEHGKRGFCIWRLLNAINKQHSELIKIGPIPGHIDKATFWAFKYESTDVLCLGLCSL